MKQVLCLQNFEIISKGCQGAGLKKEMEEKGQKLNLK